MITEKNTPHWDCRESAKGYVNIASVLSGFAFTAIILTLERGDKITSAVENSLRDQSSLAFLVGFFATILASFTYSFISGESKLCVRAYTSNSIASAGFFVGAIFIAWGLIPLLHIYSEERLLDIVRIIFVMISIIGVLFLTMSQIDTLSIYREGKLKYGKLNYALAVLIPLLPIVGALFTRLFLGVPAIDASYGAIRIISISATVVVIFGAAFSTIASSLSEDFHLSISQGIVFNVVHALIIAGIIYYMP